MKFKLNKKQQPPEDFERLDEEASKKRTLTGFWKNYVWFIGLAMALFHIWALVISPVTYWILYLMHILFALLLIFPIYNATKRKDRKVPAWYDLVFMIAAVGAVIYCIANTEGMSYRMGAAPTMGDLVAISIILICLLEGTRRIYGPILPIIALIFFLYCFFGKYINGPLGHRGYTLQKTISYMLSYEAVFGSPINASATIVILFMLFGAFLAMSGAGPYFIDLAMRIAGSKRGGPAKVAVISSALFGTVSGNSTANVVSTGSFTIPMMKSIGYNPTFAGAVEATASSGGQIMPPILGSAAFIMAELISEPYSEIMKASIIPALLYFFTVFISVDIEAAKRGLVGLPKEKLPKTKYVVDNLYMLLPLVVLTLVLTVLNQSSIRSAIWGIVACLVVHVIKTHKFSFKQVLDALSSGATSACGLIVACGTAGIVVGVLSMTGVGIKFTSFVFDIANGRLFIALVMTMLASLVLGMGLPTSASYIICAAVAAPALIEMGLQPIQAHLFVFYFACISAITPPVALAAYAGASIAGAKPMNVGFAACKLGICAFIVPFLFCYQPSLLWQGAATEIIGVIISALIGAVMLSYGLERYVPRFHTSLPIWAAVIMCGFSIFLLIPGMVTDLIGLAGCALILAYAWFKSKKEQPVIAVEEN